MSTQVILTAAAPSIQNRQTSKSAAVAFAYPVQKRNTHYDEEEFKLDV